MIKTISLVFLIGLLSGCASFDNSRLHLESVELIEPDLAVLKQISAYFPQDKTIVEKYPKFLRVRFYSTVDYFNKVHDSDLIYLSFDSEYCGEKGPNLSFQSVINEDGVSYRDWFKTVYMKDVPKHLKPRRNGMYYYQGYMKTIRTYEESVRGKQFPDYYRQYDLFEDEKPVCIWLQSASMLHVTRTKKLRIDDIMSIAIDKTENN